MSFDISDPVLSGKLVEGFGTISTNPAPFIWNTVALDPSVANKKIEIHFKNETPPNTSQKEFRARQIDDSGTPINNGTEVLVGSGSTTSTWVTTNKNAEIQIYTDATNSVFRHMNTLK